jgi:homoprotocatechuate degradation regulator HpaR
MMNTTIEELPILLQKARETAVLQMRNTLANFDLTEQQWRVIRATYDSGELNAQDLARKSAILGPSLSRILNRLEEDGILNRKVSAADQRELNISLTAKGKRLHNKVLPTLSSHYDQLGKQIGPAKLEELASLLNYLIELQ